MAHLAGKTKAGLGCVMAAARKHSLKSTLLTARLKERIARKGMQLMGGYGYARAYGMEQRLRDAWGWGIAGGSIDIQKINIASTLVGRRFDQRR